MKVFEIIQELLEEAFLTADKESFPKLLPIDSTYSGYGKSVEKIKFHFRPPDEFVEFIKKYAGPRRQWKPIDWEGCDWDEYLKYGDVKD